MADIEQVEIVVSFLENRPANNVVEELNRTRTGAFAVLTYLVKNKDKVIKSRDISEKLGVSTARMAVLLKKLEQKGLIKKSNSKEDSRVTIVKITEKGILKNTEMKEQMRQTVSAMIDKIGFNELIKVFSTLEEIKTIFYENEKNKDEEMI